jgi:hypothetical protein
MDSFKKLVNFGNMEFLMPDCNYKIVDSKFIILSFISASQPVSNSTFIIENYFRNMQNIDRFMILGPTSLESVRDFELGVFLKDKYISKLSDYKNLYKNVEESHSHAFCFGFDGKDCQLGNGCYYFNLLDMNWPNKIEEIFNGRKTNSQGETTGN